MPFVAVLKRDCIKSCRNARLSAVLQGGCIKSSQTVCFRHRSCWARALPLPMARGNAACRTARAEPLPNKSGESAFLIRPCSGKTGKRLAASAASTGTLSRAPVPAQPKKQLRATFSRFASGRGKPPPTKGVSTAFNALPAMRPPLFAPQRPLRFARARVLQRKAIRKAPRRGSFASRVRASYSEAPKARASSRAGLPAMSPARYTPPTSTRPASRQPMRSHSVS